MRPVLPLWTMGGGNQVKGPFDAPLPLWPGVRSRRPATITEGSCSFWNIRGIGIHDVAKGKAKLKVVTSLVENHVVTMLAETKADKACSEKWAQTWAFTHVVLAAGAPSPAAGGLLVFLQRKFLAEHQAGYEFSIVVPGRVIELVVTPQVLAAFLHRCPPQPRPGGKGSG